MMSQNEIVRLHELGVAEKDQASFLTSEVRALIAGTTPATRARAIELIRGRARRRDLRRYRPRRDDLRHARGDAPLLRSRGHPACA